MLTASTRSRPKAQPVGASARIVSPQKAEKNHDATKRNSARMRFSKDRRF
jgi:hypothetical protein